MGRRTPGKSRRSGVILVAFAMSIVAILGMMGLAFDLGRMYIVRNESQSYVDAAALAAATRLNGSSAGITAANNAVRGIYESALPADERQWKRYYFGNQSFPQTAAELRVSFSETNAPGSFVSYETAVGQATNLYRFVEVVTRVNVPLYLMPVVGMGESSIVAARGVAGQVKKTHFSEGLFPFAPLGHCSDDPSFGLPACTGSQDFGYIEGQEYTLKWKSNVKNDFNKDPIDVTGWCAGDAAGAAAFQEALKARAKTGWLDGRGFVSGGQNLGANEIKEIIWNGSQNKEWSLNQLISDSDLDSRMTNSVIEAIIEKAKLPYPDNIVYMPIVDAGTGIILDFRAFRLLTPEEYEAASGGNKSWCAIYEGSVVDGIGSDSVLQNGIYVVRLVP